MLSTPINTGSEAERDTADKLFLLGFMPAGEITGLVLDEFGESFDLARVKKLWLPKSQKMRELVVLDMQLLDENKISYVVKDLEPSCDSKVELIEKKLENSPFWKANNHSIKMVKIDELIVLQNYVDLDRVNRFAKRLSKDPSIEELLDVSFDFTRQPSTVNSHMISNNAALFSTDNHDIRPGKIEVRRIPKYSRNEGNTSEDSVPSLVIPIIEGDPFVYCIRTYTQVQMPEGGIKKIYFLTLQNGIHRAYALRSLGIEYMPCLLIDPISSEETDMLMANWSPERKNQGVSQRPPLMKDFFNSDLTEKFSVRKKIRCIKVSWTIENFTT